MQHSEYDYILKLAVFGADNVHDLKRNLIIKFSGGILGDGIDFNVKTIRTSNPDLTVKLQLWHAKNEDLRPVDYPPSYLRALHNAIIVYDMANPELNDIKKFVDLVRRYYAKMELHPLMAIVGLQTGLTPKDDDIVKDFAKDQECFWRNGVKLESCNDLKPFFHALARAQLSRMGVKIKDSPDASGESIDYLNEKQRLQQIWDTTTGSRDDKIIALMVDYTGRNKNGFARLFSFVSGWNKFHIPAVAQLCDEFKQQKIGANALVTSLQNIESKDMRDPILHLRRFLMGQAAMPVNDVTQGISNTK